MPRQPCHPRRGDLRLKISVGGLDLTSYLLVPFRFLRCFPRVSCLSVSSNVPAIPASKRVSLFSSFFYSNARRTVIQNPLGNMAYRPIGDPQPPHLENIELNTRYDPGAYNNQQYAPPPGSPPDRDKKDVDSKGAFRSNEAPMNSWPVHSQRAAALTSMRISLMIFDAILASTPIMFVGMSIFDTFLYAYNLLPCTIRTTIFIIMAINTSHLLPKYTIC